MIQTINKTGQNLTTQPQTLHQITITMAIQATDHQLTIATTIKDTNTRQTNKRNQSMYL